MTGVAACSCPVPSVAAAAGHDVARTVLLAALAAYAPCSPEEGEARGRIAALVEGHEACFLRDHFQPGHVTGSGLLLGRDGGRVLLNHHRALGRWLGFGGHADGEADIMNVARRETVEESGIEAIAPVLPGIFDLDIHPIPANPAKGEPPHLHFDIRYLFRVTGREDFRISAESTSLRWCSFAEARALGLSPGMTRLLEKAAAL